MENIRYEIVTGIINFYKFSSKKGVISCLLPCVHTFNLFEIYCLEGRLFDDIERYNNIEEVNKRVEELLQPLSLN